MILEANLHWRYLQTPSNLVMPWYTLPCLQWLIEQDTKNWTVFEYGAGYSSIWWRLNSAKYVGVDAEESWAVAMNVIHETEEAKYLRAIDVFFGRLDCVIVDGHWRKECVEHCRGRIKEGGFLIIDNYDSEDHDPKTTDHLLEGWEKKIYKQPNHSTWQTAVFQKPK